MSEEKKELICYSPYPDCPYTNPYYCELWRSKDYKLRILPETGAYQPSERELDQDNQGKTKDPEYEAPFPYGKEKK